MSDRKFEQQHPRAEAGKFTEKAQPDPGSSVLSEPPGLDDTVHWEGLASDEVKDRHVGVRVRTLIENGRWAVRKYTELTGAVDVIPAGSGDLAHAIPKAIPGIRVLATDQRWTDYGDGGHFTFRVYQPAAEPLAHCANGCGRRMLPDDFDYWTEDTDGNWCCDSTWCGEEDPFAPRDEPVDARDTAVTPWWENR